MSDKTPVRTSAWIFVCFLSLGILVGCKHLASEQSTVGQTLTAQSAAEETLITYDQVYAHGPVGFGGNHLTSAEIALREIYHQKDAESVLVGLYPRCPPVGKAYVLSALWHLDTNRFRVLAEDFMKQTGTIPILNFDMGGAVSREELIRGMHYQTSGFAFSPEQISKSTMKREDARRLRDTEEILSKDPNWSEITNAFTVKEIWDVDDSAVITLATNVPFKREVRLRISAPWHDGKITIQHSPSRLLAAATDLMKSRALDNVPKSKRITIWAEGGRLLEDRKFGEGLRKAMAIRGDKSEWTEVVITDWNPEGWDDNLLKLFHLLDSDVWLNEDGADWDHSVK